MGEMESFSSVSLDWPAVPAGDGRYLCKYRALAQFSQLYCASWYYQSFLFAQESRLKNIKIYIKTAPTCFGLITIIRERIIWAC
jgi:hypothetical protein